MRKIIIVVAPVSLNPCEGINNPLSPEEIAEDITSCNKAGASVVHLHVRDLKGKTTTDLTTFSKTIDLIREKSDIVINGSTGGFLKTSSCEDRAIPLQDNRLELASLNMGSTNLGEEVFINTFECIRYWAKTMYEKKIHPEMEIFEAGMINNAKVLIKEGYLKPPFSFAFCPGFLGGLPAEPDIIYFLKNMLPHESIWGVNHIGSKDFSFILTCIGMGASFVRVGFEDGFFYKSGHVAKTNSVLVERFVKIVKEIGYDIATPNEAREIIGIQHKYYYSHLYRNL